MKRLIASRKMLLTTMIVGISVLVVVPVVLMHITTRNANIMIGDIHHFQVGMSRDLCLEINGKPHRSDKLSASSLLDDAGYYPPPPRVTDAVIVDVYDRSYYRIWVFYNDEETIRFVHVGFT